MSYYLFLTATAKMIIINVMYITALRAVAVKIRDLGRVAFIHFTPRLTFFIHNAR